jgi:hypothetical protein
MFFNDDEERYYYEGIPVPGADVVPLTNEQRALVKYLHGLGGSRTSVSEVRQLEVENTHTAIISVPEPKTGDNSKPNVRKIAPMKKLVSRKA